MLEYSSKTPPINKIYQITDPDINLIIEAYQKNPQAHVSEIIENALHQATQIENIKEFSQTLQQRMKDIMLKTK